MGLVHSACHACPSCECPSCECPQEKFHTTDCSVLALNKSHHEAMVMEHTTYDALRDRDAQKKQLLMEDVAHLVNITETNQTKLEDLHTRLNNTASSSSLESCISDTLQVRSQAEKCDTSTSKKDRNDTCKHLRSAVQKEQTLRPWCEEIARAVMEDEKCNANNDDVCEMCLEWKFKFDRDWQIQRDQLTNR